MASLALIRQALADTIAMTTNLRCYPYPGDQVVPPCVVVVPDSGQFMAMQRGLFEWSFKCQVIVPAPDLASAQKKLDEYITGAGNSVLAAIYGDQALGTGTGPAGATTTMTASVVDVGDYGDLTIAETRCVATSVTVKVLTRGDA